jgi:NAD(P)-dependent dehydrogenase (short-subunit alcohol dehydrogenase family)
MIADVRGKSVLVIGGTRGIGFAAAKRFADVGAAVALTGRSEDAAREAARGAGAVAGYALDVRDRDAIAGVVERFAKERGGADALVYSAGVSPAFTSAEKLGLSDWDEILAVNATGAFVAAQAFARIAIASQRAAAIVFIGSVAGVVGAGRLAAYSASKAALIGLAKSVAWDWARHRIRVNVIAPGYVETDMTTGIRNSESISKLILSRTPQARIAAPEEIADLAVFLASESASFATGSVYTLDGGWTSG